MAESTNGNAAWQQKFKMGAFSIPVALIFLIWNELGEIKRSMISMNTQLNIFVTKVATQQDILKNHDSRISACSRKMYQTSRDVEVLKERMNHHERAEGK